MRHSGAGPLAKNGSGLTKAPLDRKLGNNPSSLQGQAQPKPQLTKKRCNKTGRSNPSRSGLSSLTRPRLSPALLIDLCLIGDLHGLILLCMDEVRFLVALDHFPDLLILDHQDCLRLILSVTATMGFQPTVGLIVLIALVELLKAHGVGLEQEALSAVALLRNLMDFAQFDDVCQFLLALSVVLNGPGQVIIVIRVIIVIVVIIIVIIVMIGMSVIIVIVVNIVIRVIIVISVISVLSVISISTCITIITIITIITLQAPGASGAH